MQDDLIKEISIQLLFLMLSFCKVILRYIYAIATYRTSDVSNRTIAEFFLTLDTDETSMYETVLKIRRLFMSTAVFFAVLCLSFFCCPFICRAGLPSGFRVPEGTGEYTSPAYAAVQDSSKYLWIGTEDGLLRYDGRSVRPYTFRPDDEHSLCNNHVSSLLYCRDEGRMVVGTDAGVSIYDFEKDSFSTLAACGYRQVKALLRDGDSLWIGTAEGLMCFDISEGVDPDMGPLPNRGMDSSHTACIRKIGDSIFFGTYDAFFRYDADGGFTVYPVDSDRKLVLDIAADPDDSSVLWIGTESGLVKYSLSAGTALEKRLDNVPVKYFFRYSGQQFWIGTDNGLAIIDRGQVSWFRHEASNSSSLPSNVVWSVARTESGDIFLCTDYGIVQPGIYPGLSFHPVSSFTGIRDGQNINVMTYDSRGDLWMAGMDGLIRLDRDRIAGRWYRSDTGPDGMRLTHNKVRDLFDDGDGLLIVSDGGLDRLDYSTGRISHYDIEDPSGEYLSTWMYSVAVDPDGRLWIGTYDGLMMIPDRQRLLSSSGVPYRADRLFSLSSQPHLSGNAVMDIAFSGRYGAALSSGVVDFIDLQNRCFSYVELPSDRYATVLASGRDCIWIGTSKGLAAMGPDGKARAVEGMQLPVNVIVPYGDRLLVASDREIYIYEPDAGEWSLGIFTGNPLSCGLPDGHGTVLLGGMDGYFEFDTDYVPEHSDAGRVSVTSFYLGGSRVDAGVRYDGNMILEKNISMTERIELKSGQNSFSFGYSSFDYSGRKNMFLYRLAGLDDSWQQTSDSRAVFINVPGGNYVFEVAEASADGTPAGPVTALRIKVRTVWYATAFAYVMYMLVAAGLCVAVFYYLRMRHQLQLEHIERDRALKMADIKTEFLSDVSHEFKSPLSIILGFVGRMIASESDSLRTRELNTVQQNAEKIHLLLDRMVQFNENGGNSLFIPAAANLQELVRSVYDRYADAFTQKGVTSRFVADDIGYIFMVDRVKMESVVQNLLSNALKFTGEGGCVLVSVTVGSETPEMVYADIKVKDTGCGIPEDELPLIFNRFYKAPSSQKDNPEGSGIGLALVKEIVEQHKGSITVSSAPGKGSEFTVRLSTMKADSFILKSAGKEEYSLHSLSNVWQHQRKPIILLVEDNVDIRDFITASLGKDYVFRLAEEGRAGLDILAREKIDLVITDISMPGGMDGLAMSRSIRNSLETAFLPIIILTGRNDRQTEMKSFEYADAFISKPFNLNYLNNRIIQLLIKHEQYLARMRQQKMLEPETVDGGKSFDEQILENVVDIVSRHIEDPGFSASALCEESRYSSKQIYRKIKQLTGMSIVEFIRDMRLRKASLYLAQGKLSVTEVMYKVGFTTASYFSKCFKEKFGVSPSDYADSRQDGQSAERG